METFLEIGQQLTTLPISFNLTYVFLIVHKTVTIILTAIRQRLNELLYFLDLMKKKLKPEQFLLTEKLLHQTSRLKMWMISATMTIMNQRAS